MPSIESYYLKDNSHERGLKHREWKITLRGGNDESRIRHTLLPALTANLPNRSRGGGQVARHDRKEIDCKKKQRKGACTQDCHKTLSELITSLRI